LEGIHMEEVLMTAIVAPQAPTAEHWSGPGPVLGLGVERPRLSWWMPSAPEGHVQTAYEVEIVRGGHGEVYQVEGDEQVLVPWPAAPLVSRERVTIRVRVAHGDEWSPWSAETVVEAGLLHASEWQAAFITARSLGRRHMPAPVLAGTFDVAGRVARARLYITAHGVYVPTLNGRRVGDLVLAPGWTAYEHRLHYQTYDVTELVSGGTNTLEVLLGNGWFRGRLGWGVGRTYGDDLALLARLEVVTDDGRLWVLTTDHSWRARESEVVADDLYDGQVTDLRRRGRGWSPASSDVDVVAADLGRLISPEGPPVRVTGVLPARSVWTSPSGRTLVDFGQNVVGWVRLHVRGLPAGSEVVVRHAEVLEDGELATAPLRSARATDTYLLAGEGEETLEPSLTFHGFRYVEVRGVPNLSKTDVQAVVIGSDLQRTGWFSSSHELLNRFHENVVWSMRGNFLDVPTDCPQRDERLGWTGDIQAFAPTATFLFDTTGFLASWLADLAAEQLPDGSVPIVVPNILPLSGSATAAWGDAATLVPWALYQRSGDLGMLERQLPSMRKWVDKEAALAGADRLWAGGFQFGDWLDPTAPEKDPYLAKADPDVVATAYFARSAEIVACSAEVLGLDELARQYSHLATEVRQAFARAYVTSSGRVNSDAQAVYALAIEWDLLGGVDRRRDAGRRLADLVRVSGFRISTGFVGTPLICDALTHTGHADVAHRLLLQTGCPSWLYPVTMGATTVWERWDSMLPDGRVNGSGMTSFNHYALGAVADWIHRSVAGLAPAAPGYRRIVVRPEAPAEISNARARHLTPYGPAEVSWRRRDGRFHLEIVVPVGTTATVYLPGSGEGETVAHGRHSWDVDDPAAIPSPAPRTVREVMDDVTLWPAVVQAAVESGVAPGGEVQAANKLGAYLDAPVTDLAGALAPPELFLARGDLESRLAEVLPRDQVA
jgi:alpha-L-rhamnosidase